MSGKEKDTFTSILNDLTSNFSETIDSFIQVYEDTRPKLVKRIYRKNGKKYYRTMLRYNPLFELLPPPSILKFMSKHLCRLK